MLQISAESHICILKSDSMTSSLVALQLEAYYCFMLINCISSLFCVHPKVVHMTNFAGNAIRENELSTDASRLILCFTVSHSPNKEKVLVTNIHPQLLHCKIGKVSSYTLSSQVFTGMASFLFTNCECQNHVRKLK